MTPEEISEMVEVEIAGQWSRTNGHLCDLRQCLVPPEIRRYEDSNAGSIELWLILEELPDSRDGYKIVFDEQSKDFGLACPGITGKDVYLGQYGSFWQTFDAM